MYDTGHTDTKHRTGYDKVASKVHTMLSCRAVEAQNLILEATRVTLTQPLLRVGEAAIGTL